MGSDEARVCAHSARVCDVFTHVRAFPPAHSSLRLILEIKGNAILSFPSSPWQGVGRKQAKGARGGGVVFPPCVHYG